MAGKGITVTKWTVVQHSGFGFNRDETFSRSLESRMVSGRKSEDAVIKAGGILFDSYGEAEDFAELAMYPPGNDGIIGNCQGTFANEDIDGLRIYIPVRKVVG